MSSDSAHEDARSARKKKERQAACMSKAPATAPPPQTAQRLLSEEFGAGASNYDEADLIVWKAAGEAAANAAARKDFLQATLELERCVLLRPDSRKSASNLARARTRCGTQFWQRPGDP